MGEVAAALDTTAAIAAGTPASQFCGVALSPNFLPASASVAAAASVAAIAAVKDIFSAVLLHRRSTAAASSGPTRFSRVATLRVSRNVRYMKSLAARVADRPRHPTTAPKITQRCPRGRAPTPPAGPDARLIAARAAAAGGAMPPVLGSPVNPAVTARIRAAPIAAEARAATWLPARYAPNLTSSHSHVLTALSTPTSRPSFAMETSVLWPAVKGSRAILAASTKGRLSEAVLQRASRAKCPTSQQLVSLRLRRPSSPATSPACAAASKPRE